MACQRKSRLLIAFTCACSLFVGACSQSARDTGGAVGTLVGVAVGATLGGGSDMGAAGGALVGGVAGLLTGALVGQVVDDLEEKRRMATQTALDGGSTVRWVSRKDTRVTGYTEIVQTVAVPAPSATAPSPSGGPGVPAEASVVYCQNRNGATYRLEAGRCPGNGGVRQITREEYAALVADLDSAAPSNPAVTANPFVPAESPAAVSAAPAQMVCKTAKEVVQIAGKEKVEFVEYCRAAGAAGWTKKKAA